MINIRTVKIDEWEGLRELNKKICINNPQFDEDLIVDFADTADAVQFFQGAITNETGVCFVAEEGGVWLGYANGSHKPVPYRHSKYFEIENLGVIPEIKGKGVGKQLLDAITSWAKEHGYQKIWG